MSHRDAARYMALLNNAEVYVGRAFTCALEIIVQDIEENADISVFGNYQSDRVSAFRTMCERYAGIVLDIAWSKGRTSDARFVWAAKHAGEIVNTGYDPELPDFHFMTHAAITSYASFGIVARDHESHNAIDFYDMVRSAGMISDPSDFQISSEVVALGRPPMTRIYRGVRIDVRRDP